MSKEIWKDVSGYEGYYQASNLGRIKSLKRKNKKGKILKPWISCHGYKCVRLSKNGQLKSFSVHQLIAIAFLGHKRCGLKRVIDHINNIKHDNRLENLQIVSHRYNCSKDQKGTSKYVGASWCSKRRMWASAIQLDRKSKHLGYYDSEEQAHEAYNEALIAHTEK